MSVKYHINPETGNPNKCTARSGNCPFAGDADHFPDKDSARASYEARAVKDGLDSVPPAVQAKLRRELDYENTQANHQVYLSKRAVERLDEDVAHYARQLPDEEWSRREFEANYGELARDSMFSQNHGHYDKMKAAPESFSLGERVMIKALRWVDFGMLGTATGAAAGTAIYASQGRPGMAAIMGTVTALMSTPQWLPMVRAKLDVWKERRELEKRKPQIEKEMSHLKAQREARVAELLAAQKRAALVQARMDKALNKA